MPPDRGGDSPPEREGADRAGRREVIFEFRPIGSSIKVIAVDVATGVEVSVVGPATAAQSELERIAARKLRYMLEKKSGNGEGKDEPDPPGGAGGGIIV